MEGGPAKQPKVNDMEKDSEQPESAGAVSSTRLLAASPWFPLSPEKMAELQKQVMDAGTPKTETEWWARREIVDLLEFVREQVEAWDNDGDCGFPLYEHGKRIMARHAAQSPTDTNPLDSR